MLEAFPIIRHKTNALTENHVMTEVSQVCCNTIFTLTQFGFSISGLGYCLLTISGNRKPKSAKCLLTLSHNKSSSVFGRIKGRVHYSLRLNKAEKAFSKQGDNGFPVDRADRLQ